MFIFGLSLFIFISTFHLWRIIIGNIIFLCFLIRIFIVINSVTETFSFSITKIFISSKKTHIIFIIIVFLRCSKIFNARNFIIFVFIIFIHEHSHSLIRWQVCSESLDKFLTTFFKCFILIPTCTSW